MSNPKRKARFKAKKQTPKIGRVSMERAVRMYNFMAQGKVAPIPDTDAVEAVKRIAKGLGWE